MNDKTWKDGIARLIAARLQGFKEFNKAELKIWRECLDDLPDEVFIRGINTCLRTLKYFPTISEIREASIPDIGLSASDAWTEVMEQKVLTIGYDDRIPKYSNPIIGKIVESLGGIDGIWEAGVEKENYLRKQFMDSYQDEVKRERKKLLTGQRMIEG